MATTTILNDLIDLNQTGNTTALKGCVGTNAQQPANPTISVQYLVVGGGGGGNGSGSGGAGAGAFVAGTVAIPNNTAVTIAVGQGGPGVLSSTNGEPAGQGQDSGFYTIQGQGGGGAAKRADGRPGGSGAGGGASGATAYNGGSSTAYGNDGGDATSSTTWSTGGGGGAGSVGGGGTVGTAGAGGIGSTTTIISTTNATTANVGEQDGGNLYFAGGGGGGGSDSAAGGNNLGGSGGLGGGGDGTGQCSDCPGGNGTLNTGGGGGGSSAATVDTSGGNGGSGVVILKYANTATETIAGSLAGGITTGTTSVLDYPSGTSCVALYEFESNGDSTSSASNNQTTVGTLTYSTGNFNNAVSGFSGSNYFATSGLISTLLGSTAAKSFTISAWIKATNNGSEQHIAGNSPGSTSSGAIMYLGTGGQLYFNVSAGAGAGGNGGNGNAGGPYAYTSQIIDDDTWHQVAVTYSSDGTTSGSSRGILGLFVDGVNVTSSATFLQSGASWTNGEANPWTTYTDNFFRTGRGDGTSNPFNGAIDQLRIFQSVLSDNQIAMLYAENVGATKFTESSDTVLVFKGGSGTINLTDTSLPGPKVGDLRTNTDQSSASSASAMEHYMSTGWRVFDNYSTLGICDYPITAAALYQFEDTPNATCGPNPTTTTNLTYVTGKFSKAVDFNGTNSVWQTTSQIINSQSNFSISMWVKVDAYASGSYLWTSYITGDWTLNMGGTGDVYIRFAKYNDSQPGTYIEVANSSASTLGQWYHVCGTFSTTTGMVLYIDGISVGSDTTTWAGKLQAGSNKDSIGCYGLTAGGDRANFNGQIDQFRAFQSTLTAAQVTELYNEQ